MKKNPWIRKATLYFDIHDTLNAELEEREPIARLFTTDGQTFYIDHDAKILPMRREHLASLPIFTGFKGNIQKLNKADSGLIKGICYMSLFIQQDTFLNSMIDQVSINHKNQFELVPSVGKMEVLFGDTSNLSKKFEKFSLFYKKAIPIYGWNRYEKIDLTYNNMVVAKYKDAKDIANDSLRALHIMNTIAEYASKKAEDTTNRFGSENLSDDKEISMILQSLPRDYENETLMDTSSPIVKHSNDKNPGRAAPILASPTKPPSKLNEDKSKKNNKDIKESDSHPKKKKS